VQFFQKSPIPIAQDEKITHVTCGSRYSFVVVDNRKIFVTGGSSYGALLLGDAMATEGWTEASPEKLQGKIIKFIGCGSNTTSVVTTGATCDQIYAAGYSTEGECGLPFQTAHTNLTEVDHECFKGRRINQIAFGYCKLCLLQFVFKCRSCCCIDRSTRSLCIWLCLLWTACSRFVSKSLIFLFIIC
jgi:hypothetical protein